jgi:hypothetical protein
MAAYGRELGILLLSAISEYYDKHHLLDSISKSACRANLLTGTFRRFRRSLSPDGSNRSLIKGPTVGLGAERPYILCLLAEISCMISQDRLVFIIKDLGNR